MTKIFKVSGSILLIAILIILPLLFRHEILYQRRQKYINANFPQLIGINIKFDIDEEMKIHPFSVNSILDNEPSFFVIKTIGISCPNCYSSIQKWKHFFEQSKRCNKINVIFFVYGKDNDAFINSISTESFPFLLIMDQDSSFINLNGLKYCGFQTYVLDSKKNVVQIGDPLEVGCINNKIKRLLK